MELDIRPERPTDAPAIHALTRAAFGRESEADLVDLLRERDEITLSLVAERVGVLVGHVLYSPVTVTGDDATFTALALGPISVHPDHQRRGIGAALIHESFSRLRAAGHHLVFLLGHPEYYPRFGFRPAVPLGFDSKYIDVNEDHAPFMVAALRDGALNGKSGTVHFRPAFDEV